MLTEGGGPKPVIYDTDMGSDDWLAALLLLRSPAVEVRAITVTGAGLARVGPGVSHALGLAALAGKGQMPVAGGRQTPLRGSNAFPPPWRDGTDAPDGLAMPTGGTASERTAVETILSLSRGPGRKLTVVATGPLTNLAEALEADGSLAGRLEMVYVMGGAVSVGGNVHATWPAIANTTAEWNFYVDPAAAAAVLSRAPVTLVPLDATNAAPVTPDFYARLERRRTTPWAEFVFQVLRQRRADVEAGAYYFWDALAAAAALDEGLTSVGEEAVRVVEAGEDEGRTEPSASGVRVRVCRGADLPAFERLYLDTING